MAVTILDSLRGTDAHPRDGRSSALWDGCELARAGRPFLVLSRSGFTLVEVLLVIFILVLTAAILGAIYPSAQISRTRAVQMTYALSLAQQKIEESKSAGYDSLLITSPTTTPVSELTGGSQTVSVSQYSAHIKKIDVMVQWGGYRKVNGNVHLVTFVSDNG